MAALAVLRRMIHGGGCIRPPAGWVISRRRACADRMRTATLVHDEQEFVVPKGCRCRSGGVFLFDQLEFALREGLPLSRLRRVFPGQRAVMHEDMPLSELQRICLLRFRVDAAAGATDSLKAVGYPLCQEVAGHEFPGGGGAVLWWWQPPLLQGLAGGKPWWQGAGG